MVSFVSRLQLCSLNQWFTFLLASLLMITIAALQEQHMATIALASIVFMVSSAQTNEQTELNPPRARGKFTLKDRVKYEGITSGCVIPLCSKPAFLKMLLKTPTLLESFFQKTLDNRPGEKVLVFIANGLPMAQQLGAFTARKNLNRTLRQVKEAAEGIEKVAREVVSKFSQQDQDRIAFTTWQHLLDNEPRYEAWYRFIMENEQTRAIVRRTAMGIVNYRISSFKKKGIKCATILDEDGNVCDTVKAQNRFLWTEESCAREITTLIWGFNVKQGEQINNYKGLVYMTPNSTGMDIISGGAFDVLKLMQTENLRNDLPTQSKLTYTQLTMHKDEPQVTIEKNVEAQIEEAPLRSRNYDYATTFQIYARSLTRMFM